MQPFIVDWQAAVVGGLVGTLAMTAFWYACRAAGAMKLDFGEILGTFFYPAGGRAMAAGLSWHMLMGLVFGAIYGFVLTAAGFQPTWASGLVLGLIHAAVAVAMLYPLARMHPALNDRAPGAIWSMQDRVLFAVGYPIFGAFFGMTDYAYQSWASATQMDPFRFWMTAFGIVAIALVVGLATFTLLPRWRAEEAPIFMAAHPDFAERRAAVEAAFREGRISQVDYEESLAAIAYEEAEDADAHRHR